MNECTLPPVEALPIIARGYSTRILSLENRVRPAITRGILAQISHDFHAEGIELFDVSRLEPPTFERAVAPVLQNVVDALQVDIIEDQHLSADRALYKCLTNVSGLLGVNLRVG